MHVLATYNIKGGVGKTASAVNLAWLASHEGLRTLVWDLDPQGAASFYLGTQPTAEDSLDDLLDRKRGLTSAVQRTPYSGLHLLPASLAYRHLDLALGEFRKPTARLGKLLAPLAAEFDLVIIDCAPSLSLASENVFGIADWLLVPVIPTPLSIRAYEQLQAYGAREGNLAQRLLPFFSMIDRRRQLQCTLVSDFAAQHPEVLRSFIPYTSQVERMGEQRAPLHVFAAASPGARAFLALWQAIKTRTGITAPVAGND